MPIRVKLVAALAAELVVLLVVVIFLVAATTRRAGEELEQTDLAAAAVGPAGLMSALQNERNWASVALIGQEDAIVIDVRGYDETRQSTDRAVTELRAQLGEKGGAVAEAYQPALDAVVELGALRADIDGHDGPRTLADNAAFADGVFARYADLIRAFHEGNSRVALAVNDPSLRLGAELVDAISRQIETVVQLEADIVKSALPPDPAISRDEIRRIAASADTFRRQAHTIATGARGPYRELVEDGLPGEWNDRTLAAADAAALQGTVDIDQVLADASMPVDESYTGFRDRIAEELRAQADVVAAGAERRVQRLRALAAAAVVLSTLAIWLLSRSITQPLHSLTRQAADVAHHRLPEAVFDVLQTPLGEDVDVPEVRPVSVRTKDEVADVADAINVVQGSALNLAVEQAVLRRNIADSFVSLGRRNQLLLGRQLDFITELEAGETDPDVLADLFRLDHLATRMRRNAESLLLLAGVELSRRWAAPMRIADVIRAALGEVEDYQRVTDRGVESATLTGSAAADVAHVLAELIDNALIYSPPDQAVEVRGGLRSDGYTLAIVDAGIGMPPDELERANRRLSGAESMTVAPSKYLGHYVVGKLAALHDIQVTLQKSPGTGLTATVTLPRQMLALAPQRS